MMTRILSFVLPSLAVVMLGGCVSTLGSVVTAPVKAVGKAADWATTSQDEADRNRGRKLREKEEKLGRLARKRAKYVRDCDSGNDKACADVERIDAEIDALQNQPI